MSAGVGASGIEPEVPEAGEDLLGGTSAAAHRSSGRPTAARRNRHHAPAWARTRRCVGNARWLAAERQIDRRSAWVEQIFL